MLMFATIILTTMGTMLFSGVFDFWSRVGAS